jgi:transposase
MRIQLSQQVEEILGKSELLIITERVDDVALLIGQMVKMGFPEVLDRHIPRHWKQRGLSWGWTAVVWLAYILTEGDHRKVSVETYIKGMKHTLSQLTGQAIEPLDFSDDRLEHLLKHLSKPRYWHGIERELNERSIEVYELPQDVIRCDATTVSGDHEVTEGGLLQFGQSKDDPSRPQIKVMMGSLDPLGMPLSTDVLSGERADDGLDIPVIDRIRAGLSTSGLLFVGDCKMSALDTRAHIVGHQHVYLSPLP